MALQIPTRYIGAGGMGNADTLNVLLILVSLALAFVLPFSLFLFSYAVLGPLHYMTEINWLNDRGYFMKSPRWMWLFVLIAMAISVPALASVPALTLDQWPELVQSAVYSLVYYSDILLLSLLILAVGLLFIKKWWHIVLFFSAALLVAKLLTGMVLNSFILTGIFLPTLIHVYLFTLFFMVLGAMNSQSRAGWIGVGLLVFVPVVVALVEIPPAFYASVEPVGSMEKSGNFRFIQFLGEMAGVSENGRMISLSVLGLKLQTFVAFAYTYHYLNWFSKVSVIGWQKQLNRTKTITIASLWLGSIALFAYNYEMAYLVLFFMAILHIVLEFPLNMLSLKMIGKKVMKLG